MLVMKNVGACVCGSAPAYLYLKWGKGKCDVCAPVCVRVCICMHVLAREVARAHMNFAQVNK